MTTEELFQLYARVPRDPSLGRSVFTATSTGLRWVIGTALGSLVLGAPLSLVRRSRHSAPWEPLHMLYGGLAIAIFAVPIAFCVYLVLRSYVKIFRDGRLVEGVVLETRNGGVVVRSAIGVGPDLSFVPGLALAPGQRVPMLVGHDLSSKALFVAGSGDLRRCSLLTPQQLVQVADGAPIQG